MWNQADKESATTILHNWVNEARESGIKNMKKLADTIDLHRDGILAYYDYRISSGKVDGVNNKIKTIKRQAYGFRDDKYFMLRILSMHDDIYAKL
ncbi:MAG: transposase [Salinivirgaceae bacterium]|nr:transposase [Salinivirgaceae bacterium]